ncbi:hypothetical protein LTR62_001968 [Meristemomyces frigidus]|uniref:Uncharacterized protein n=1 Tax=Meristemomyces frigidus TaxID=1508187 RepID=A0AAN7T7S2_9PEZI|nr:hypothetical protein LTR62_001968 [Meristemomyces frigidus]
MVVHLDCCGPPKRQLTAPALILGRLYDRIVSLYETHAICPWPNAKDHAQDGSVHMQAKFHAVVGEKTQQMFMPIFSRAQRVADFGAYPTLLERYREAKHGAFRRRQPIPSLAQYLGEVPMPPVPQPQSPRRSARLQVQRTADCAVNGRLGVNASGIEQRHGAVCWLNQQHYLRATQNDGFSALFD